MSNRHGLLCLALLAAIFLFLSLVSTRAQQIRLEVANAVVVRNHAGDVGISVTLSAKSQSVFAAFSKEAARKFIEIRSSGDVLAIVRLETPIEGGVLQFVVRDTNVVESVRKLSESGAQLEINVLENKR